MAKCHECRVKLNKLNNKHGKTQGRPPINRDLYAKELLKIALDDGRDLQLVLRATNALYLLTNDKPMNTWIAVSSVITLAKFCPENGNGLWYYRSPLVDPNRCPLPHIRADGIVEKRTAKPLGIWDRVNGEDEIRLNVEWINSIGKALLDPKIVAKLGEYN